MGGYKISANLGLCRKCGDIDRSMQCRRHKCRDVFVRLVSNQSHYIYKSKFEGGGTYALAPQKKT